MESDLFVERQKTGRTSMQTGTLVAGKVHRLIGGVFGLRTGNQLIAEETKSKFGLINSTREQIPLNRRLNGVGIRHRPTR